MSANFIYYQFKEIYGISIKEEDTKNIIYKLFTEDMIFWPMAYNNLDEDRDYIFYLTGNINGKLDTMEVPEQTFIEIMNIIGINKNWENNELNIVQPELRNHRLHKIINLMDLPD